MCDDRERLIGYVYDECEADERQRNEQHLAGCLSCRQEIAGLRAVREDLLAWDVPSHASIWRPVTTERVSLHAFIDQLRRQLKLMAGERVALTITLDADWLYRRLLPAASDLVERVGGRLRRWQREHAAPRVLGAVERLLKPHRPRGTLAVAWPTGSMALWMLLMLLGYLVLYYALGERAV